jgi:hypothetical protein
MKAIFVHEMWAPPEAAIRTWSSKGRIEADNTCLVLITLGKFSSELLLGVENEYFLQDLKSFSISERRTMRIIVNVALLFLNNLNVAVLG